MTYTAYILTADSREKILAVFPPKYKIVKADHVTVQYGVGPGCRLPPKTSGIEICGYAHDEQGIEALVVAVDGNNIRPDGKIYHITLSYDPDKPLHAIFKKAATGYRSSLSNDLIAAKGYRLLTERIPVMAVPAYR